MRPIRIMLLGKSSGGGGGGGGGGISWANILKVSTPPVVGANADQTMTGTGTLNFSYNGSASYSVFKNGISQGQLASLSVAPGHTVHFQFTSNADDTGTMTVSGLVNNTFTVSLQTTA